MTTAKVIIKNPELQVGYINEHKQASYSFPNNIKVYMCYFQYFRNQSKDRLYVVD